MLPFHNDAAGAIMNFLASSGYAETTREIYRRVLVLLVQIPALSELSAAGLIKFLTRPEWGNSQRYVYLCACRKFLIWAFGAKHPALSARIKRIQPRLQRVLTIPLALKLLASFNPHEAKGSRDLAIAALALDTGLRLAELCRLEISNIDLEQRTLQVIVKGGQWGSAVFSPETAQYVREWLCFRRAKPEVDALFVSTRSGLPLTREGLQTIVKKWGARLGIKLSPHDLRRSMATLATVFGAPTRAVQVAGRWSNIEMVEHYTRSLDQSAIQPYLPVSRLKQTKP